MNKYYAEAIGTFALVFCGTGSIIINQISNGGVGNLGIAFSFGLIIMAMIYSVGHISGAHFNPAVTIGFGLIKKLPAKEIMPYILAQLIGAIIASGSLKLLFPLSTTMGQTTPAGSILQTFILEVILTYLLMFVIVNVATGSKDIKQFAGLAIGSTVLLEAAFAGPISGASMNPVRSIAPAIFAVDLKNVWIYIFAPILGSILAIGSWKIIRDKK